MNSLDVNGDSPILAGLICDAILCVEYRYAGKLIEPANTVHICFGGVWHRLYFDAGIIFWRESKRRPESYEAPELDSSYLVVDLAEKYGLLGLRLSDYEMATIKGGSYVNFIFDGCKNLAFINVNDLTSYQAA